MVKTSESIQMISMGSKKQKFRLDLNQRRFADTNLRKKKMKKIRSIRSNVIGAFVVELNFCGEWTMRHAPCAIGPWIDFAVSLILFKMGNEYDRCHHCGVYFYWMLYENDVHKSAWVSDKFAIKIRNFIIKRDFCFV